VSGWLSHFFRGPVFSPTLYCCTVDGLCTVAAAHEVRSLSVRSHNVKHTLPVDVDVPANTDPVEFSAPTNEHVLFRSVDFDLR